jgi:hypothetical protein
METSSDEKELGNNNRSGEMETRSDEKRQRDMTPDIYDIFVLRAREQKGKKIN